MRGEFEFESGKAFSEPGVEKGGAGTGVGPSGDDR